MAFKGGTMGAQVKFETVRAEYAALWAECEIRPERDKTITATAKKIIQNRPRYDAVSRATGVPWYVIGIIHQMECSLSFTKHLHNGDSLKARTWQVPAGRPKVWPPSGQDPWDASAIDALTMPGKEFHKITDWSVERVAYTLELYNGFGYRLYRKINSPYLWSFTTHYKAGKYVADGKWSASAVSGQSGAMAILKKLIELDAMGVDLKEASPVKAWPKPEDAVPLPGPVVSAPVLEAARSRSVWALVTAFFVTIWEYIRSLFEWLFGGLDSAVALLPQIDTEAQGIMAPLASLGAMLQLNIAAISTVIAGVCIVIAIVRHSRDKAELVDKRKQVGD